MLSENYIEALLVDEELADQVWEAWDAGALADGAAGSAILGWMIIAASSWSNQSNAEVVPFLWTAHGTDSMPPSLSFKVQGLAS